MADRPDLKPEQLERTRDLMNKHGGAWQVGDYETLIPTLVLPDADDRHVLAAAISAGTSLIVTFNLKDFPARVLTQYGVEACTPDDFTNRLLDTVPIAVIEAVRRQRAALRNPPRSIEEHLVTLEHCGVPRFAKRLQTYAPDL